MGMNMAYWYDPSTPGIVPAYQATGITSIRWPGGTAANTYHWVTNTVCFSTTPIPAASSFDTFLADVIHPGNFDLALTVNYGTDAACTGPGDPSEAAAWVQNALNNGNNVSHVTVGNEDWGSWVTDLHTIPYDPTTYANATANGILSSNQGGQPQRAGRRRPQPLEHSPPWDPIVLAQAKYDFVEYHFYPQGPRHERRYFPRPAGRAAVYLGHHRHQAELATAGVPNTPIYIGEIGSVYAEPGKQTMSITQALYAGQVLGEMMNQGVSLAAWWLGIRQLRQRSQQRKLFQLALWLAELRRLHGLFRRPAGIRLQWLWNSHDTDRNPVAHRASLSALQQRSHQRRTRAHRN
jgi:hypothetical protein